MPAQAQTVAEYNAVVASAQAKVDAAYKDLVTSQKEYNEALEEKEKADQKVAVNKEALDQAITDKESKEQAVLEAQALLASAQTEYNTALISDPNWERPKIEQVEYYDVPYTVQVPYTELAPRTEIVPRTILVPHTELVATTTTTMISDGLTAKTYNMYGYNNAPPLPGEDRLIATQTVANIDYQWGGGYVMNTYLYEDTIVKFTGYITIPQSGTYGFYAPGDDGVRVMIDGSTIINDWYDKGGGGSTTFQYMTEGTHEITLWFYENGGGAWVQLQWAKPGYGWEVVPATAFGQAITETTYEEVTTYIEETTYEEVTIYDQVTLYREETLYRQEERTIIVPDENAEAPLIKNPDLLPKVTDAETNLKYKQDSLSLSEQVVVSKQVDYEDSVDTQSEKAGIIEVTSSDVVTKQQELDVAKSELEAIPPFRELPPTPEKTQEPAPEPTENVTEQIPEPEQTTTPEEPTNPTILEAEAQLEERAALNDTGVLPYTVADAVTEIQAEETLAVLTNPAALGEAVLTGLTDAAAFVGEIFTDPGKAVGEILNNVGAAGLDMSDDQREKAQEVIVPVIIVSQIASMMVGRIN